MCLFQYFCVPITTSYLLLFSDNFLNCFSPHLSSILCSHKNLSSVFLLCSWSLFAFLTPKLAGDSFTDPSIPPQPSSRQAISDELWLSFCSNYPGIAVWLQLVFWSSWSGASFPPSQPPSKCRWEGNRGLDWGEVGQSLQAKLYSISF